MSVESEERMLPYVVKLFGEDYIFSHPTILTSARARVSKDIPSSKRGKMFQNHKRKILSENAKRFYRLS